MQSKNQLFSKLFVILFSITILLSSCSNEDELPIPEKEEELFDKDKYPEYLEGKKDDIYFQYSRKEIIVSHSESSTMTNIDGETYLTDQFNYNIMLKLDSDFVVNLFLVNPQIVLDEYYLVDSERSKYRGSNISILAMDRVTKYTTQNATVKVNTQKCLKRYEITRGGYYLDMTLNADVITKDNKVIKLRDVNFAFYYEDPIYKNVK